MTVESAKPILYSLLPAFQLSSDLLGEVLMVLRKTIWKLVNSTFLPGFFQYPLFLLLTLLFFNSIVCCKLIRSVEARRVSVSAMVLLLSSSTIIGAIPKSQFQSSQSQSQNWAYSQEASQSNYTQTDVLGSSSKNESVCFEVLSILKRFFSQQLEVREHLYFGKSNARVNSSTRTACDL